MTILTADQFPGAEHQRLTYPGLRPDLSYAYYLGKAYEIRLGSHYNIGDPYADLWVEDRDGQVKLEQGSFQLTQP